MRAHNLMRHKKTDEASPGPSPLVVDSLTAPVGTNAASQGLESQPASDALEGEAESQVDARSATGHDFTRVGILGPSTTFADGGPPDAGPPSAGGATGSDADAVVRQAAAAGTGAVVPIEIRDKFERSLGTDLTGVRVHADPQSARAARQLNAKAFTVGQDIYFAQGRLDPSSESGRRLLAHEVSHTAQQRGSAPQPQYNLEMSAPGDAHEQAADRAAEAMIFGRSAAINIGGVGTMIARDVDKDMADAGWAGGEYGSHDAKVTVIMGHSVTADENEAKSILGQIQGAEKVLSRHPTKLAKETGGIGPMKSMLAENVDAKFVIEQYLATVSESGDFQSEYAASYMSTKKDYGEFMGMWQAFEAAGGSLKKDEQASKMAAFSKDNEFVRARGKVEEVRNQLKTDRNKIDEGQTATDGAKAGLMTSIYSARGAAAASVVKKKQGEMTTLMNSINEAVSTIMTVGKIAAAATTGVLAMGAGGMDMNKLVESNPEIAPGNPVPGAPAAPSLAPPDVRKFATPGTDLNPHGTASPEDGLGKPNDTRTYSMPSQTVDTVKDLAGKGAAMLGGPEAMLKQAITMLEQSNIDRIQAQIDAAQEDNNLQAAASAAAEMRAKRLAYQEKISTLAHNVGNLMDHKSQMDTAINDMVTAAKRLGGGKDLTGAIRLVGSGDKFLAQIDMTLSLGAKQQQGGRQAALQRYNINAGPLSTGTAQGPGQLHYWTVANDKAADDYVGTKHLVELKSSGKASLASGDGGNSTQFDVGKSLEELAKWKVDVQEKRDRAQSALGIGVGAGHSG